MRAAYVPFVGREQIERLARTVRAWSAARS